MRPTLSPVVLLALLLAACGGGESVAPIKTDLAAEAPAPAPAAPETPELTVEQLREGSDDVALVPSPIETQRALEASGIDAQLASLIPKHAFDIEKSDPDHAAVRTGVVLADALLTVKSADKAELILRLETIEKGMIQLGGGPDIAATLEDMRNRLLADAVTRDELLKEFDELAGAVIPELEFNGNERVVPLIQAGSWLEGANLVAKAVKKSKDPAAADALLKQPEVVAYFITYVKTEGAETTPEAVTLKLEESLGKLKALAEKPEPLAGPDIATVIQVTGDVLALL